MDEVWIDVQYALEEGDLTEDEFRAYLERISSERAIELLGDFTNPEWS